MPTGTDNLTASVPAEIEEIYTLVSQQTIIVK